MPTMRRRMMGTGISRLRTMPLPNGVFGGPPVSGYVAWFDAVDAATITATEGLVSQWSDKSGNANHLVQATGANQPLYGPPRINGLPAIMFDGSNDVLAATGISGADRTSSFFGVVNVLGLAAANTIRGSGGGTGGNEFRVNSSDGKLQSLRSGVNNIAEMATPVVVAGTPFVAGQVLTATDVTQYLNAASETDANSDTYTAGRTTVIAQNRSGGTSFSRMVAGELVFYDTSLSSSDALNVIGYLMSKWGIT